MLKNSGESGHPCRVPDLKEKALFFPIEDDISYGLFIYDFLMLRYVPSIPTFFKKGCCILSNAFSARVGGLFLSFVLFT